jgi:hypothetical protein
MNDTKELFGQWSPLIAQLEGAGSRGSALSHLVAQSLLLQAAKVLTKGQEKFADLQTALNLTESLYAQNNKIVGELELELSELKASADKEITHWQSAAVEVQQDNERLELREADNLNLIISQRREVEDLRLQLAAVTKERDELKSGKYDIGSMLSSDDYPPNEAALIKDNGDAP